MMKRTGRCIDWEEILRVEEETHERKRGRGEGRGRARLGRESVYGKKRTVLIHMTGFSPDLKIQVVDLKFKFLCT